MIKKNNWVNLKVNNYMSAGDIITWLLKIFTLVVCCLIIGKLARINDYLTLVFVCLLCGNMTAIGGLRAGKQQFLIMVIGSALAFGLLKLDIHYYVAIALGVVIISFFVIYFNYEYLLPVAYFSVLYIGILGKDKPIAFFYERFLQMLIAVPLAVIINYIFGLYNYRKKLIDKIMRLRINSLNKIISLIKCLESANNENFERELKDINVYYRRINYTIDIINDIEAEYKSLFSFMFKKIPDLRLYKIYVWNLHDLLQTAHNTIAFNFKEKMAGCMLNYYLVFAELLEKFVSNSSMELIDEFYNKSQTLTTECKIDYPLFSANFIAVVIHLKSICQFEQKLPLLKERLKNE